MKPGLDTDFAERFMALALRNPINREILRRLPSLGLEDCWLVAGCLFQAIWNGRAGRGADAGVHDYDIFYFESSDLSWEAEDRAIARTRVALADLGIAFDLKNQARVHLWYQQRFGSPCPRLTSACDGIDRFPVAGTCVGLSPNFGGDLKLYAPFGLDDIFSGKLRPTPSTTDLARFHIKAASYQARWPFLTINEAAPDVASTTSCMTLRAGVTCSASSGSAGAVKHPG